MNSVNAGIMMSQLLYWHEKGKLKDGWVYKTIDEMRLETGLTRTQQETAIRICLEYEFIETKLAGIPAKRHFKINLDEIENRLPALKEDANVVYPNPPLKYAENLQTITENTQDTTTKNTHRDFDSTFSIKDIISAEYGGKDDEFS